MAFDNNGSDISFEPRTKRRKDRSTDKNYAFAPRKKEPNVFLKIFITSLKVLLIIVLLTIIAGIGVVIGVAKAYVDSAPPLDLTKISEQSQTSFIYDDKGNLITKVYGVENGAAIWREWVNISDIPVDLQNAFIAIEDERFRQHNGIDIKGIARAFVSNLTGNSISGGSTITQQLIKNTMLTPEQTYKRKIQEAYLAIDLERKYTKDQILEAYLNTINLGNSFYGIKAAANGYFGKELNELSLREMATLAGITKNPSLYNPWRTDKADLVKQRSDTVLYKMYELGYINGAQYKEALAEPIKPISPEESKKKYNNRVMPYFVDYALVDVKQKLTQKFMQEGLNETDAAAKAEAIIQAGGLKIYTTVDSNMQKILENAVASYKNYPKLASGVSAEGKDTKAIQPQTAAVIIDYHTGQVKALVGGRSYPDDTRFALNRAYQSKRPVGSTMKPLGVYGPALDLRTATAATTYDNIPAPIPGWVSKRGYPANFDGETGYTGLTTMREAIRKSINIVAAKAFMQDVGVENSYNYVTKFGLNILPSEKTPAGLTLGAAGASPLEMAAAYGAIANNGVYIEPIAFTRVVDKDGNTLLDNKCQDKHVVLSEQAAFILTDMLKDVVTSGTGTPTKLKGMTSAGKTGTTDDFTNAWFVGFTPYYSAAVWMGHDDNKPMSSKTTGGGNAGGLWKAFMQPIHQGLKNKDIYDKIPSGIIKLNVCTVSGELPTDLCYKDPRGSTVRSEYFIKGTQPTTTCSYHVPVEICKDSGKYPTEYCPKDSIETVSMVKRPDDSPYYTVLTPDQRAKVKDSKYELKDPNDPANQCDIHTKEWYDQQQQILNPPPAGDNQPPTDTAPPETNPAPGDNTGPNDNNTPPSNNDNTSPNKPGNGGQNTLPSGPNSAQGNKQ